MSQTTLYAGVLAKIGAERSKLVSKAKFEALTESRDLPAFVAQLRETTYQEQITKLSTPLTSRKLERAFNENLIESYIKIVKNSPVKARHYLDLYLLRFELENIKALIKAAYVGLSLEEKLAKIYLSVEDYLKNRSVIEEAAKAPTLKQTVNAFKNTEYTSTLNTALQNFEETGSTSCFDVLLDSAFYNKLYDYFIQLPKREQLHARFYASMENDGFTLLTALRGKILNHDANWLRTAVPHKNFHLTKENVEALISAADFESALKIALESHYANFFVRAQNPEETVANAEKAFKRAVFQHAKESRVGEIFNIGAALAFMTQKEAEVHNLIAASSGVDGELKREDMQGQLLL